MTHTVFYDAIDMRAMSISGLDRLMVKRANGSNLEMHMPLSLATAIAEVFKAHKATEAAQ